MTDGQMILLIFALILLVPLLGVALVWRIAVLRRRKRAARCSARTEGAVERFRSRGRNTVTLITVTYTVDGKTYRVTESLKYRSEAIRIGRIPVGQRRLPVLGPLAVGDTVPVRYCPEEPALSLIEGNEGFHNC